VTPALPLALALAAAAPAGGDSSIAIAVRGVVLGWSVAAIPGPINIEMIRRGLKHGTASAFAVGVGASTGDFLWAIGVTAGVGALGQVEGMRRVLTVVSTVLLLALGLKFLTAAVRALRRPTDSQGAADPAGAAPLAGSAPTPRAGFLLGLTMAITSPFNIAFWLGILGASGASGGGRTAALVLAFAVVAGALIWCTLLCGLVRLGARFSTPRWEAFTEGIAGSVMIYAALRTALGA
jgi:threonine/homoserine/homoserine lactone efflux protein